MQTAEHIETNNNMRGELTGSVARLKYIYGGKATFTLIGKLTRFTYRVTKCEREGKEPIWFVSVLVGPDNWTNYKYAGIITDHAEFRSTAKSKITDTAPSILALRWFLANPASLNVQFWHEGACCICGRKLTVPESIASGIGPVCANK